MKYFISQAEIEQLSAQELEAGLEYMFNDLAAKKQALEECHCMMSLYQNAIQKQRLRM